jgi:stage III sporulation protein AD
MIKIGLIGIAAAFLGLLLGKEKKEYSFLVALAAGILIFFYSTAQVKYAADFIQEMLAALPVDENYVLLLFKMIGVSYLAEFSSNLCRDAGYTAVAGGVELFARLAILVLCIPGIVYILEILENFL